MSESRKSFEQLPEQIKEECIALQNVYKSLENDDKRRDFVNKFYVFLTGQASNDTPRIRPLIELLVRDPEIFHHFFQHNHSLLTLAFIKKRKLDGVLFRYLLKNLWELDSSDPKHIAAKGFILKNIETHAWFYNYLKKVNAVVSTDQSRVELIMDMLTSSVHAEYTTPKLASADGKNLPPQLVLSNISQSVLSDLPDAKYFQEQQNNAEIILKNWVGLFAGHWRILTPETLEKNPDMEGNFYNFLMLNPAQKKQWFDESNEVLKSSKFRWFNKMFVSVLFANLQNPSTHPKYRTAIETLREKPGFRQILFDQYRAAFGRLILEKDNPAVRELRKWFFDYLIADLQDLERAKEVAEYIKSVEGLQEIMAENDKRRGTLSSDSADSRSSLSSDSTDSNSSLRIVSTASISPPAAMIIPARGLPTIAQLPPSSITSARKRPRGEVERQQPAPRETPELASTSPDQTASQDTRRFIWRSLAAAASAEALIALTASGRTAISAPGNKNQSSLITPGTSPAGDKESSISDAREGLTR